VVKLNDIHQLINQTTVMSFEVIQLFLTATSREHYRLLRRRFVVLCGAYVVLIVLKYKTVHFQSLLFCGKLVVLETYGVLYCRIIVLNGVDVVLCTIVRF